MTIADVQERGKTLLGRIPADILIVAVILLCSSAAFGLGILAGKGMGAPAGKDDALWIEQLPAAEKAGGPAAALPAAHAAGKAVTAAKAAAAPVTPPPATSGTYVASKTGTKYYLPTCGTAKRIKDENKVWFATKEDAQAAGYAPASNCPGL